MVSMEFLLDLDSFILRERLTEYRIPGLALKRRNYKDRIMVMKLNILRNERNCPDMESDIFTCFLEKYVTTETSGKYQIVFPSGYVPSAVQEPHT